MQLERFSNSASADKSCAVIALGGTDPGEQSRWRRRQSLQQTDGCGVTTGGRAVSEAGEEYSKVKLPHRALHSDSRRRLFEPSQTLRLFSMCLHD
ncbi:hypothetical protein E1301_Tti016619 [Triplophysa tibetana]|uniref:Uncharacterized protein n=1 Tax=Triplophysa tibetana TaxID=1572043 RepID=A0A5A9P0Z4_9TELE|nr:hypothetical protein E1301_Tti016619 [Triplophysa tibetana]